MRLLNQLGKEACSGAHHWARQFQALGHTVRLVAPKFVAPCRMSGKRGKNDGADAAAICEAVQRPPMRFVPIKTVDQQVRLMVHRARQGFVEQRTGTINGIRGLRSLPVLGSGRCSGEARTSCCRPEAAPQPIHHLQPNGTRRQIRPPRDGRR